MLFIHDKNQKDIHVSYLSRSAEPFLARPVRLGPLAPPREVGELHAHEDVSQGRRRHGMDGAVRCGSAPENKST